MTYWRKKLIRKADRFLPLLIFQGSWQVLKNDERVAYFSRTPGEHDNLNHHLRKVP